MLIQGLRDSRHQPLDHGGYVDDQHASYDKDELVEIETWKADGGEEFAQVYVGNLHYHGHRTVPVNHERAQYYYAKAAARGNIEAKTQLVRMHIMKQSLLDSNETMRRMMEELIDAGSADATNLKGCVINNDPEALRLFEVATQMHPPQLPVALTNTGVMYRGIAGSLRNESTARAWFVKSAARGDTPGRFWLGTMEIGGHGGPQNCTQAVRHLASAVRYYVEEYIVPEGWKAHLAGDDAGDVAALFHYTWAAELGLSEAAADVYHLHARNRTGAVPPSPRRWAELAFAMHHPASAVSRPQLAAQLGTMHVVGIDGAANETSGELYLRFAAERNVTEAAHGLGWLLQQRQEWREASVIYWDMLAADLFAGTWASRVVGAVMLLRGWWLQLW